MSQSPYFTINWVSKGLLEGLYFILKVCVLGVAGQKCQNPKYSLKTLTILEETPFHIHILRRKPKQNPFILKESIPSLT